MDFSVVVPIKDEVNLIPVTLPSYYALNPGEVILCLDKPAPRKLLEVIDRVAKSCKAKDKTKVIEVKRHPAYRYHKAFVRRTGFRVAKHDTVVTGDIDLIVNRNVLKAVELVGNGNVGFVSMAQPYYPFMGVKSFWRMVVDCLVRRFWYNTFTGLYALWKPYWLDTEKVEDIQKLPDPRSSHALIIANSSIGEDSFLHQKMLTKHRAIYLRDIGGFKLAVGKNDLLYLQFQSGKIKARMGKLLPAVLFATFLRLRPLILSGYIHARRKSNTDYPLKLAYWFLLKLLLISIRVPLRTLYGKEKRNKILESQRWTLYHWLRTQSRSTYVGAEKQVVELVKGLYGDLFVDIGANFGRYSVMLSNNFKEVLSIEPEPKNMSQLKRNTRNIPNVRTLQVAIGESDRFSRLFLSPTHPGQHTTVPSGMDDRLFHSTFPDGIKHSTRVKTLTLAYVLRNKSADLIKVDVEGAEFKVLEGAKPLLNKIKAWIVEIHDSKRRKEIQQWFRKEGYKTTWLSHKHIYASK